ncbi:MAG: DUF3786 domain-containing protein [Desulfarculus sp.]|nr:DUF3786 domain-containing protein [Pseudomonadota bacterium]MBV1716455.1 DUF3786 domain-containing protein [Desulfarculus sp.]MBU4576655.1 DUF3786 domain-containing protein [Pseudomonadota bacterium]MBU4598604.1 DUF3786 domain-containing protein [Pseudomonadota bacterium]MBV1736939.1 DUF3786 domain-containing protein [Desulfarculus sp.]
MSSEEPQPRAVFSEIRKDYLSQLAQAWGDIDFSTLGVELDGDAAIIPFFGLPNRVSLDQGFQDHRGEQPSHATCVALAKYLLLNAGGPQSGDEWVALKQFPDAAPFVEGFANTVERKIAKEFVGKGEALAAGCALWGGKEHDAGLSYDLVMRLDSLPRIPLLLLFNDEEDPFPAQCSVLYQQDAPRYLDMECLAIMGITLGQRLVAGLKGGSKHKLVG